MAEDRFEAYFAEKLWEMIPPVYRHEDGLGENPGVLRAIVEIIANQAAVLRRSQDRLWDDQFAELASDWAIPYLADLVGTRLVSALNPRGRRVDVAKTIYYRRRKGTLAVLEELISDIAGWDGAAVESFRRLARSWHRLDPAPDRRLGPRTGTPPGGTADLRRPQGAELAGGPFDEYHHTPDLRRPKGRDGRYGINRINFHLYRIPAFRVEDATPAAGGGAGAGFLFDPSGRDVPLFRPRGRPAGWDAWRPAREWEVPAPIRCRLLNDAVYEIDEAVVLRLEDDGVLDAAHAAELRTLRGTRYSGEARLRRTLATLPSGADFLDPAVLRPLLAASMVEECGKAALLPAALRVEVGGATVPPEEVAAGGLDGWTTPATGPTVVVDPERGRLLFAGGALGAPVRVTYHYGFPGEIGAGTYDRREVEGREPDLRHSGGGALAAADLLNDGVVQLDDSATYGPVADKLAVRDMTLQAANQQRPYIRLDAGGATPQWRLATGANSDSRLVLDGLWIGAGAPASLRLEGDYEHVILRHVTLDPGGALTLDPGSPSLPPVVLEIRGHVELLEIDASVTGPIRTAGAGVLERLVIRDSIVQSTDAGVAAIALEAGELILERVTVLGALEAHRLWATEALITGVAEVNDEQHGCFRFGAAPAGSRLPHPYESHVLEDRAHIFTSRRFGDPGYAQLSETAPESLRRGAENGSEIGAYGKLMNPVGLDGLRAKIDEYLPFGRIAVAIRET
jgi:hypothetical protein